MKNLSVSVLVVVFIMCSALQSVNAQMLVERQGFEKKVALVDFPEKTHDFGQVPEENGAIRHTFEFLNSGEVPVRITGVQTSCGCTTPEWTREEIEPGAKGRIVAEYDPANRPGQFNKTLTVSTNAEPNSVILTIKGTVKPRPRTPEDDFPVEMGKLRVLYRSFNFGKVTNEGPVTKSFEVYNQGDKALTFSDKVIAPTHVKISFQPKQIPPKSRGEIVITYDVVARKELGWVNDNVVLETNEDGEDKTKSFSLMATIEEYFPPMTEEELAQAPRLKIDKTTYEFGKAKAGSKIEAEFTLTNGGQKELNIRKTKANCGCTVSDPEKDTLAPGESTKLKATFDTKGLKGNQYKTITVFSNDPTAPTQTITLKGEVQE